MKTCASYFIYLCNSILSSKIDILYNLNPDLYVHFFVSLLHYGTDREKYFFFKEQKLSS